MGYSQSQVAAMANSATTTTSYYEFFSQSINELDNISEPQKIELIELLILTLEVRVLPAYATLAQQMETLTAQAPGNIGFGQFEGGDLFYSYALKFFRSGNLIADSEDGSRPGAFYASTVNDLPYYTIPTLTYHESIPGHHIQIALDQEIDFPRFRREMHYSSFIEGWGLYAERLAKDLGWYEGDVYGDIGRLQFEAMRASSCDRQWSHALVLD